MQTLRLGMRGTDVLALQALLLAAGCDPQGDDGDFGPDTDAAVRRFQGIHDLTIDGLVGWPSGETADAMRLFAGQPPAIPVPAAAARDVTALVTPLMAARMFPGTPLANIERNLPAVLSALATAGLGDRSMVLMALATIRAETAPFEPVAEGVSKYNTSGNSHDFDRYDGRQDLGNGPAPDGANFRGRGYVQLTGRANYAFYGNFIGQPLTTRPALASDPLIAGELLAAFLKAHAVKIRSAVADNDLATARRLVNGGSHGLDDFIDAWQRGLAALPA